MRMGKYTIFLILVAYCAAAFVQSRALPPMEGSDETLHVAYVEYLRQYDALPDRSQRDENCTAQESGQPPLTYALAALVLNIARRPLIDCNLRREAYTAHRNAWSYSPDPWIRGDNARVYTPFSNNLTATFEPNLRWMRGLALAFGLLAITGAYAAAGVLFKSRKYIILTTIVFAFTPQITHLGSYFNNDISSIAFATLLIWRTLRLLRDGATSVDIIVLGLISGLAALCKVSVLLILPAIGLALWFEARRHQHWFRRLLRNGLLYTAMLLVVLGPWMLDGLVKYQDPLGTATHLDPKFNYDPPRPLSAVIDDLDSIYLTYLGKFGFSKVLLRPATYTAISILALLALSGYLRALLQRNLYLDRRQRERLIVLAAVVLLFGAGFYRWYTTIFFVTARLLMPVHLIFVLFLVYGWKLLAPRSNFLSAAAASVFMVSGAILTPLAIYDAYSVPPQQEHIDTLGLSGPQYTFDDTIRFLGYDLKQELISERGIEMDLCWEILKPPERRAAFSVKLVLDGEILADRTSLFGLGNYDSSLWTVGHRFCDFVDVPVNDPDTPADQEAPFRRGTTYDILLVVLDADTFAVDWQATLNDGTGVQYPFVGQVATVP